MAGNPKKGSWQPPQGAPVDHAAGFAHALADALKDTGWPPGDYPNVKIEHSIDVHVENPGTVWTYRTTLSP